MANIIEFVKQKSYLLLLLTIIMLGISVRLINIPSVVTDFDPWWYFRHTQDAFNYGFSLPKWDIYSYAPAGRPYIHYMGVEYAIALSYKIFSFFAKNMSLMKFFILSPAVISGLTAIPAYLAGRLMSNKIGGLLAGALAVVAPTFISYSVAGYLDSKAFVMFYSFIIVYLMMLAMKKSKIWYYIPSILANVIFVYTWQGGGWYPLLAFMMFLPAFVLFRIVENMIHQRKFTIDFRPMLPELKKLAIPYLIILISVNIITQLLGLSNIIQDGILSAFYYSGITQPLLVNISVAELQNLNIFTLAGFTGVANQVGLLTTLLTIIGLPMLVIFKLIKREHVRFEEIFLFLFALITFYMILHGIRFALIFAVAAALSAGYVIGNVFEYLKHNTVLISGILGAALLFVLIAVSNAYQVAASVSQGYGLDPNWISALNWLKANSGNSTIVATWWDPGHIIAGYAGLKAVADGAHCPDTECMTGGINMRIQDMGYVLTTDNETQAVQLLQKYMQIPPQQCDKLKSTYGNAIYDNQLKQDPCAPLKTMYFIASNDLIGKYYWPRYFSSCLRQEGIQNANICYSIPNSWFQQNAQGANYAQLSLTSRDSAGDLVYGGGTITLAQKNNQVIPILNLPNQGVTNAIIQNIILYNNNQTYTFTYNNSTNVIAGTLLVDPSFQTAIFMDSETANSIFTKMYFFDGKGLARFQLVYTNPIIKIFKVEF